MHSPILRLATFALTVSTAGILGAAEWYVSTDGKPDAPGSQHAPWDLESALSGRQKVAPGDTVWILGGTYKHPDRKLGSRGYVVKLAGEKDRPIHIRGMPGQRAAIDGGLTIDTPSTALWIRDLEILVSENLTMSRTLDEPGSHPKSYARPWGGLNVYAGEHCKFINLVIHDNAQGISWWRGSTDSDVYGCIIYDNGWKAPDRGHGHAIYTQNQDGLKTISDCIMTGGFGYTMHAYGSSRAYVDNYLVEGNICYDAGTFLIGGGRPSRGIRVLQNNLHNVGMQIGYTAPHNEDCEVRGNVIVGGGLQINRFRRAVDEQNLVRPKDDPRLEAMRAIASIRPNRYDSSRAHVVVFNPAKKATLDPPLTKFLAAGDRYRLMNPRDFYGKPVVEGTFGGKSVEIPVAGRFAAFVLLKRPW